MYIQEQVLSVLNYYMTGMELRYVAEITNMSVNEVEDILDRYIPYL